MPQGRAGPPGEAPRRSPPEKPSAARAVRREQEGKNAALSCDSTCSTDVREPTSAQVNDWINMEVETKGQTFLTDGSQMM